MTRWIVLFTNDQNIRDVAIAFASQANADVDGLFSYSYTQAQRFWQQYNTATNAWQILADAPRLPNGDNSMPRNDSTVSFSGHGNNQSLGDDDHNNLTPLQIAELLQAMNFGGIKVIISACGTNAVVNTFGGAVRDRIVQIAVQNFNPIRANNTGVWACNTPMDVDVNPLGPYYANGTWNQWPTS